MAVLVLRFYANLFVAELAEQSVSYLRVEPAFEVRCDTRERLLLHNGSCMVDCIFLVNCKLFGDFHPFPFGVFSASGWWRVTASYERPDQDAYCLFLIAFNQVGFVGNPAAALRYHAREE